jgi:hypothetical protein
MLAVFAAGSAQAQSASGTLSSFRTGYSGAGLTGLESPISPSLVSTSSQFAISDGVNQAGSVGSVFATQPLSAQTSSTLASSSQSSGGAGQSYTGVGQGAVSNQRAPVAVVETTTAAKTQTSTAAAAAAAPSSETAPSDLVLNGKLNLDGGQ